MRRQTIVRVRVRLAGAPRSSPDFFPPDVGVATALQHLNDPIDEVGHVVDQRGRRQTVCLGNGWIRQDALAPKLDDILSAPPQNVSQIAGS